MQEEPCDVCLQSLLTDNVSKLGSDFMGNAVKGSAANYGKQVIPYSCTTPYGRLSLPSLPFMTYSQSLAR